MTSKYVCEYCKTECSSIPSLIRHKKIFCVKNTTEKENIELKKEIKQLKNNAEKINTLQKNIHNSDVKNVQMIANNSNNNNSNNNNNITNNYMFIINYLNENQIAPPPLSEILDAKPILIPPIEHKTKYFKYLDKSDPYYNYTILSEYIIELKDYKSVVSWICNNVKNLYIKNDPKEQQIWNSDTTRLTYIIRHAIDDNNTWSPDMKGQLFNNLIIKPILDYLKSSLKIMPASILYARMAKESKKIAKIEDDNINMLSSIKEKSALKAYIKSNSLASKDLIDKKVDTIDKLYKYIDNLKNNKTAQLTMELLLPFMSSATNLFDVIIKSIDNNTMHDDILKSIAHLFRFNQNTFNKNDNALSNTIENNLPIYQLSDSDSDDEYDINKYVQEKLIYLKNNHINAQIFTTIDMNSYNINYESIEKYDDVYDFINFIIQQVFKSYDQQSSLQPIWNIGLMSPCMVIRVNRKKSIEWIIDTNNKYTYKYIINPIIEYIKISNKESKILNKVHSKIDKLITKDELLNVIFFSITSKLKLKL